ncbi:MAG: hypothetical protein HDS66_09390 [Bacteroidales bacterium]|nr:hypothetical protein [Bacteroidales bacterium]
MFDRTNNMFRYSGLPETIPEPMFEYMIQVYGSVAIIEHKGDLYAMRCNFGGPPDPYYRPTQAVIANPALDLGETYRVVNHLPPFDRAIWEQMPPCVRVLNDSQIQGLLPLFSRYATQMAENDISIRSAQINLRQQHIIAADNGVEAQSAAKYIQDLEDGKLSFIAKRAFTEGVSVSNVASGTSNIIIQLIELQQYLKASWYNEIGLNSNFNMKRQYMSADELNSSADIMLPLIDNMYDSRKSAVEAINKQFGTSISVEKDSAWEKKQIQADLSTSLNPETGEPLSQGDVEEDEQAEENRQIQQDDEGGEENNE